MSSRSVVLAGLAALMVAFLAACSGGGSEPAADPQSSTAAPAVGRVVALGEEFLLADLLALGVRPVASTATVADAGFQGIEDHDTDGIVALPSWEPNVERLASFRPDTIVVGEFVLAYIPRDRFEALSDVIVVPDDATPEERLDLLGRAFGRTDRARALQREVADARAAARADVPTDCRVSVVTIYPGPSVAAWVEGPTDTPSALDELGCQLVPSADGNEPDSSGRVRLSLEQLELLDAPRMVLLQSSSVEGEDKARDEIEANALWTRLPAVAGDRVAVLDRLGYPGADGRVRLYHDLIAALV